MTYSEIDAAITDAVRQIAASTSQLEAIQAGAQGIVDTLNRLVAQKGAVAAELDSRVNPDTGDKRGDAAWEALKARKDEVVADLQSLRTKASAILQALEAAAK